MSRTAAGGALPGDEPARVVRRRYHFHIPGVAYAATVIVIVLGAVNGQNNLLFWLFGLGVAGLLMSGVLSGAALMGLELSRDVPCAGTTGEPFEIRYRLRNSNRLIPAFALTIEELPGPDGAASWPARFAPLTSVCPHVRAGGAADSVFIVTPRARGRATFARVRVSTTFPFGLTRKSVTFEQPGEAIIRPRAARIDGAVLPRSIGRGESPRAVRRGRTGDEFYALREYTPGDSIRRISWRASARLARPVVRELAERPGTRVWIAVRFASEGAHAEAVVSAAAGLVNVALARGLEVGVDALGGSSRVAPAASARHAGACLDALALAEPGLSAPTPAPSGDAVLLVTDDPGAIDASNLAGVFTPQALGVDPDPEPPVRTMSVGGLRRGLLERLGLGARA
ncbi:MAG: DUF58 domain-containing protein [Planctomycetota bacterium]|nr:DUF58 domain-containing protein [Planctomycetota bacterium]